LPPQPAAAPLFPSIPVVWWRQERLISKRVEDLQRSKMRKPGKRRFLLKTSNA